MLNILKKIYHKLFLSTQARRVAPWLLINGDKNLRLNYPLTADSIVFDVGGFEGSWASDIFSMYTCTVYVFEPIKQFAAQLTKRFIKNPRIKIYDFGLAGSSHSVVMSQAAESSSLFKAGSTNETVKLIDIAQFISEQQITQINLMKINIEGGEYELLERLLSADLIKHIDHLQIQFHDFVPEAKAKMLAIRQELAKTHYPTYQYEFVWESWTKTGL